MALYTFSKKERLCSKVKIQELFEKGSSFYAFPFKVLVFPQGDTESSTQVLISVPKRTFKRAVDRNKIKRLFRESYRQSKSQLDVQIPLSLAFIYTAKTVLPYVEINRKMPIVFRKVEDVARTFIGLNK